MSDLVLVIIAPSHLAGATVVHAWPPDDLHEAGSYNLDRPHPTEPGMIGVAVEDVRTIEIPRGLVDRFALVTVELDGEPWVLTDIGMRMLQPRELARAQGFDDSYQLVGTKAQQVARIGNSVCPPVARALIEAQLDDRGELRGAA